MKRLAVFVSGGGSNLKSIILQTKTGILKDLAEVVLVISSSPKAFALQIAQDENIKALYLKDEDEMLKAMRDLNVDIAALAGYLSLIGSKIVKAYEGKILNIHPALLPKFGGRGMFGRHVHEAVIKAGEQKSGATVHFVDEHYDSGKIVLQKEIDIKGISCAKDLAKKVLEIEHQIYPQAIKAVIEGEAK